MMTQRIKATLIASVAIILSVAVTSVSAQMADIADLNEIKSRNSVSIPPANNPFSLFDLSKIRFSQSYSVMYGSSSYGSGSLGLYTGSVSYEFSPVLSMAFSRWPIAVPGSPAAKNTSPR